MRWEPALVLAVLAACRASDAQTGPASFLDLGLAASVLPNLGLAATASAPVRRTESVEWRVEARFTDQFVDDKSFSDNGMPEAGNWTQLELGVRAVFTPEEKSSWSVRFGAVGFEARGEPNIVDLPGDYAGAYVGVGRETRFAPNVSIGPEIVVIAASGPDDFVLVPLSGKREVYGFRQGVMGAL